MVRKHRAPKGALRHVHFIALQVRQLHGQKAPSAKRCIKTENLVSHSHVLIRQKAQSAKRCIKTVAFAWSCMALVAWLESTERQKVH